MPKRKVRRAARELSTIVYQSPGMQMKLIKEFAKKHEMPVLKAAYVEEACYVGANQLEALTSIKSKEELLGEIVILLQSPAKNVLGALQSGGNTISGLVKALESRGA